MGDSQMVGSPRNKRLHSPLSCLMHIFCTFLRTVRYLRIQNAPVNQDESFVTQATGTTQAEAEAGTIEETTSTTSQATIGQGSEAGSGLITDTTRVVKTGSGEAAAPIGDGDSTMSEAAQEDKDTTGGGAEAASIDSDVIMIDANTVLPCSFWSFY